MNPYITSAIIVTLVILGFVYSIWMKIKTWSAQKQEKEKREGMYRQVSELSTKVQAIEDAQKEMLKILRELKGDKGSSQAETLEDDKGPSQTDNTTEHPK